MVAESEAEENNAGIAILLKFGNFLYYTGGDLESSIENDFISTLKGAEHLCAFKCGHHGSKHSTSEKFVKDTEARVAFISCGKHSYAHPDDPVIKNLCASPTIQKFYLTNCCYNRAGVNPEFHKDEVRIMKTSATELVREAGQSVSEAKKLVACAKKLKAVFEDDDIQSFIGQAELFQQEAEKTLKEAQVGKNLADLVTKEDDKKEIDDAKAAAEKILLAAQAGMKALDKIKNTLEAALRETNGDFNTSSAAREVVVETLRQAKYVAKSAEAAVDAAKLAEELRDKNNERELKGYVAGDEQHLGTILLHVRGSHAAKKSHLFHVGYWDCCYWDLTGNASAGIYWKRHWCVAEGDGNELWPDKSIGKYMSKALTISDLSLVDVSYSPGRWDDEITHSHQSPNFYRFWLPTKAAAELQAEKESKYEYIDAYEEYLKKEKDDEVHENESDYENFDDEVNNNNSGPSLPVSTRTTRSSSKKVDGESKRKRSESTDGNNSEQEKKLKVGDKGEALHKSTNKDDSSSEDSQNI